MIFRGFRFGLLLQIAIGPVCLFIFKTATESGIVAAEAGVVAATMMDTIFVTLAILGVGTLLERQKVKLFLKYFGTAVLFYFGLGVILGSFGIHIIPTLYSAKATAATSNAFITSFILTASSPLSILFWTGVFSTKIANEGFGKTEMILFGVGAVLATLVFLGIFAFIMGLLHLIISNTVVKVLNVIVGGVLIGFGLKMAFSKMKQPVTA